jgi:hypothetical protein
MIFSKHHAVVGKMDLAKNYEQKQVVQYGNVLTTISISVSGPEQLLL